MSLSISFSVFCLFLGRVSEAETEQGLLQGAEPVRKEGLNQKGTNQLISKQRISLFIYLIQNTSEGKL